MTDHQYDDGLIHSHDWAVQETTAPTWGKHPRVADTSTLTTPSSTVHDDLLEIGG